MMKLLHSLILATSLTTTIAYADKTPDKTPDKPAEKTPDKPSTEEVARADADKFLVFFNSLADAIANNKDNCSKMATAINKVVDANKPLIGQLTDTKYQGKKFPKDVEDKMHARTTAMKEGMEKCGNDKDVQAAFKRMNPPEGKTPESKTPESKTPESKTPESKPEPKK
jgi:hypothetical protein